MEYHSSWKIIEERERKIILTYKLEIHIIELPKIKEKESKKDKLLDWLYFLENPESERIKEKMKENEELRQAKEKLIKISADEKMQRIADLRQKAIMDEKAIYAKGLDDGIERGKKERENGTEEKNGKKDERIQIAKRMLKEKIDTKLIEKITGLTKDEIAKI